MFIFFFVISGTQRNPFEFVIKVIVTCVQFDVLLIEIILSYIESGNDNTQLSCFTLQGEQIRIKNMKDLFLYSYVTDFQAWYVVENRVSVSIGFILQKKNCLPWVYVFTFVFVAWNIKNWFLQSKSIVTLRLDCSRSRNCTSHRGDMDFTLEIPSKTAMVITSLYEFIVDYVR